MNYLESDFKKKFKHTRLFRILRKAVTIIEMEEEFVVDFNFEKYAEFDDFCNPTNSKQENLMLYKNFITILSNIIFKCDNLLDAYCYDDIYYTLREIRYSFLIELP